MLFHVDMIYLAKQAKCDVEKAFEMRTVTKSNPELDFFSFMPKRRKYADVSVITPLELIKYGSPCASYAYIRLKLTLLSK